MGTFGTEATEADLMHHPGLHRRVQDGRRLNLRRARKQAQRELAERKAAANRLLHGRSKAQRDLDSERDAKASRDLERHRIETGDER
jgi:hypothetical protein